MPGLTSQIVRNSFYRTIKRRMNTENTTIKNIPANCSLLLGDCLERMKEIPDGSVDMILCDLPYGTTACKWDTVIPFEPLWAQYRRVAKRNAAQAPRRHRGLLSLATHLQQAVARWQAVQRQAHRRPRRGVRRYPCGPHGR